MSDTTIRNQPRFAVRWAVFYQSDELLGQGTLLDVSLTGGKMAGTMPVEVGSPIELFVYPPHKHQEIHIQEAVVTWVKGETFGLQFKQLKQNDQRWLSSYSQASERRNSFRQLSGLMRNEHEVAEMPLALPVKE